MVCCIIKIWILTCYSIKCMIFFQTWKYFGCRFICVPCVTGGSVRPGLHELPLSWWMCRHKVCTSYLCITPPPHTHTHTQTPTLTYPLRSGEGDKSMVLVILNILLCFWSITWESMGPWSFNFRGALVLFVCIYVI